jgi:hypothetical protein
MKPQKLTVEALENYYFYVPKQPDSVERKNTLGLLSHIAALDSEIEELKNKLKEAVIETVLESAK